jgi:hypothetical protein
MHLDDVGRQTEANKYPADMVVLDCESGAMSVAEIAQLLMAFKRGKRSFVRPAGFLCGPI